MNIFKNIIIFRATVSLPFVNTLAPKIGPSNVSRSFWITSKDSYSMNKFAGTSSLSESNLPTIEQLSKDPFMKQVGYAFDIVPLLEPNNSAMGKDEIQKLVQAQLSHSDGIRGFFVSYLTGGDNESTTIADEDDVPSILLDAMNNIETEELISLACMNVIMPVAMTSMHKDVKLAAASKKTAKRGCKILKAILNKPGAMEQCRAIYDVAKGDIEGREDEADIKYWVSFFDKWGYKEKQKKDIQITMKGIIE